MQILTFLNILNKKHMNFFASFHCSECLLHDVRDKSNMKWIAIPLWEGFRIIVRKNIASSPLWALHHSHPTLNPQRNYKWWSWARLITSLWDPLPDQNSLVGAAIRADRGSWVYIVCMLLDCAALVRNHLVLFPFASSICILGAQ